MVMATYGGPLIKPATQERLRLPPPLEHSDSFDSLIGILKSLPEMDSSFNSPTASPRRPQQGAHYLPEMPPPPSFGGKGRNTSAETPSSAPMHMSPNTLAAKVEALQKKLLGGGGSGGGGGGGGMQDEGQMSSFSFKLNSRNSPQKPLAEGRYSGVVPWKMFGDEPGAAANPKPVSVKEKHLLPERPPLVRGGSFTVRCTHKHYTPLPQLLWRGAVWWVRVDNRDDCRGGGRGSGRGGWVVAVVVGRVLTRLCLRCACAAINAVGCLMFCHLHNTPTWCLQIKPKKKRRVTVDEDDVNSTGLDWASLATSSGGAIDDPLIDTYLDICFADAPENSSTVLSIDHEVRRLMFAALQEIICSMPASLALPWMRFRLRAYTCVELSMCVWGKGGGERARERE
jgi:hypothetical protein